MANKFLDLTGLQHFLGKIKTLLSNKVDKVNGKGLSTNDYSTADKGKLSGIAANAQVNTLESVKLNGTALPITAKSVNLDLTNYALKTDITSVLHYKGQKDTVATLPTSGNVIGDMYNVKSTGANYVWDGTTWDKLSENTDLSIFYTKDEANAKFATKEELGDGVVAITTADIDLMFT